MKPNVRLLRKSRQYSEEFKKQVVADFESGELSVRQLSKLHGIANPVIYRWIYKFSNFNEKGFRVVEMEDSSGKKMKEMEARIKELEAALGRKQIQVEYFEKMIELAKTELDIDIKKNYSTPQSTGSEKIKKK
ncbi:Transposase [Salinimicrobium catena]|uniref:Transposase n=1 Tax=Salinimicrobium catena TaxID=390640 RepID=A0A1H5JRV9_9FLAO|nr:transposase [Salinimicrobium catena]SDK89838.1 Transposase [Salinimicrobium catena]SEE55323.1 Transposase [Salinimicrobium catena]